MSSTYIVYNLVPLGIILLLSYMFIDIFLDYFRKTKSTNLNRILLYSFLFYLLSLIQIKFGAIIGYLLAGRALKWMDSLKNTGEFKLN